MFRVYPGYGFWCLYHEEHRHQNGTSKGLGPDSEECGRNRELEGQRRTKKVLERWPPDFGSSNNSPQLKKQMKRHKPKGTSRKDEQQMMGMVKSTSMYGCVTFCLSFCFLLKTFLFSLCI